MQVPMKNFQVTFQKVRNDWRERMLFEKVISVNAIRNKGSEGVEGGKGGENCHFLRIFPLWLSFLRHFFASQISKDNFWHSYLWFWIQLEHEVRNAFAHRRKIYWGNIKVSITHFYLGCYLKESQPFQFCQKETHHNEDLQFFSYMCLS